SLVVTRSVLAPEDRRASTLPLIPGSLAELPRAVGITRLLISRPPLRRVLLALVHHHLASGEDPARGPDHHPVGSLRHLLPRAVGRVPRLLPAGPPGRLEKGALVSHPVTGQVDSLGIPGLSTRIGWFGTLQGPEPVSGFLIGRGRATARSGGHGDLTVVSAPGGVQDRGAVLLVEGVVQHVPLDTLARGHGSNFLATQRAGVDREVVHRTIEGRVGAVLGFADPVLISDPEIGGHRREAVVRCDRSTIDVHRRLIVSYCDGPERPLVQR